MITYSDKHDIIQWIVGLNDQSVLLEISSIKQRSMAIENDISDQEREAIKHGLDDSANGRITPHSEAKQRYEKWL